MPAVKKAPNPLHSWYSDGKTYQGKGWIREWWVDGQLHRIIGPAILWDDGTKVWVHNHMIADVTTQEEFEQWINIKQVTENGIIYDVREFDNNIFYYKPGASTFHREGDLPAIQYSNGNKEWRYDHGYHRSDGPAKFYNNSEQSNEWWYCYKKVNVKSQEEFEQWLKLQVFD